MPKCLLSQRIDDRVATRLTECARQPLQPGQVRIKSHYSGINYKDALGVTGKGLIFKKLPIVGGIDVSGEVIESSTEKFKNGDHVLVTGCGLGETHDGGYGEEVLEDAELVVKIPDGLTTKDVMVYGTAGFTAALALHRMVQNGQLASMGPIVVTGASGGVGQFAIEMFAKQGFEVWAVSGKPAMQQRLSELGAARVLTPKTIAVSEKPLDKALYGGVVDNVGGELLQGLIPHVNLWGNVACVGLAAGAELQTTVMSLILRGVSLLGTSSNNTTWDLRLKIWQDLATRLRPKNLESYISRTIRLNQVCDVAQEMLDRRTYGRTLISYL